MFLDDGGKPLPFGEAVLSGRATGVPGAVAMLQLAHREHGRLAWSSLFGDAERTARDGFIVSPRLARFVNGSCAAESARRTSAPISPKPDGALLQAGDRLRNPAYADFLRRLAAQGADALYRGPTAARIVERTRAGPLGGTMTLADLAAYRPVKREPLCRPYRVYLVCVPPPPSSGVGLLQLLAILERTDIAARGPGDPQAWFLFAEASRLMYADRDRYVGDPAFVAGAGRGPARPGLCRRARAADRRPRRPAAARRHARRAPRPPPPTRTLEPAGTSHFIVRDAAGNVVSMTTTVESMFGSGRMVDGFFLNNQMTDFAFQPRDAAGPAGGQCGRAGQAAALVDDAADPARRATAASPARSARPGGNAILAYVAKSLVARDRLGAADAARRSPLPNLVARGADFNGEVTKFPPAMLDGLRARGIELQPGQGEDSGVHGVHDPRRPARRRRRSAARRRRAGRAAALGASSRPPRRCVAKPSRVEQASRARRAIAPRQARPSIDQRRVELDQARAGADPVPGVDAVLDPAGGDQRQRAAGRARGNRAAARAPAPSAARPTARRPRRDGASASGGRDIVVLATISASIPRVDRGARDAVDRRRARGRARPSGTTGGPPAAARLADRGEQLVERALVLQRAQARRVGRGDVDGEIVGDAAPSPARPAT